MTIETRGRKPKDTVVRDKKITFKVSEVELQRMQSLSEYLEIPKTVLVRDLTFLGLEEVESLKRSDSLRAVQGVIKTSEWLRQIIGLKRC